MKRKTKAGMRYLCRFSRRLIERSACRSYYFSSVRVVFFDDDDDDNDDDDDGGGDEVSCLHP